MCVCVCQYESTTSKAANYKLKLIDTSEEWENGILCFLQKRIHINEWLGTDIWRSLRDFTAQRNQHETVFSLLFFWFVLLLP